MNAWIHFHLNCPFVRVDGLCVIARCRRALMRQLDFVSFYVHFFFVRFFFSFFVLCFMMMTKTNLSLPQGASVFLSYFSFFNIFFVDFVFRFNLYGATDCSAHTIWIWWHCHRECCQWLALNISSRLLLIQGEWALVHQENGVFMGSGRLAEQWKLRNEMMVFKREQQAKYKKKKKKPTWK